MRRGVVRSGIRPTTPTTPTASTSARKPSSASARKPSSASATPSTRSIDFASDKSPLQKLELELKHISQGEANAEGIARSLSRRKDGHLQRTATSPSSSPRRHRVDREDSVHSSSRYEGRSSSHHHHHLEMPSIFSHHKHHEVEEEEQDQVKRKDYYKTLSGAENLSGPQPTYDIPPSNPTAVESNNKVGFMSQHRRFFKHSGNHGEGSGHVIIPTERVGGGFIHKVARLVLEDRELEGSAARGIESTDEYGRKDFSQAQGAGENLPFSSDTTHGSEPSNFLRNTLELPGSLDGPADTENSPNIPEPFRSYHEGEKSPAHHHHHRHEHDPEHPSHHHHPDHLQAPHTKEEREDALILSYIRAIPPRAVPDPTSFSPPLSVKCGPLLRYTGLRRDDAPANAPQGGRETWRGSVMVVTTDSSSEYSQLPSIRLYYVNRSHGERGSGKAKEGKFREVEGQVLHAERGVTFWRFNLEVELADTESKIAYRINHGPPIHFWVPAVGQTMNIMFHSCNGFSLSVNPDDFNGPDPLWKDVLDKHKEKPFHVMIGGGDQSKLFPKLSQSSFAYSFASLQRRRFETDDPLP